jgi:hypothetical protein
MDFVIRLPCRRRCKGVVWVVVDRLSKVAHFIPIGTTDSPSDLAPIYVQEIVRLHGFLKPLFFIGMLSLNQSFGRACSVPWVHI